MARPLKVLFLSSEVEPFAKTGGLADVAGALPPVIRHLGHDIRVAMPLYGGINGRSGLHDSGAGAFPVPVGGGTAVRLAVREGSLGDPAASVPVYFLDNPELFGRAGLYVDPATSKDYPDNDERFIVYARGALEAVRHLGWHPDIIHCNDWHTGLVPAYLKTVYRDDPAFRATRSLFTVNNMAYQGVFRSEAFGKTLLPARLRSEEGALAFGNLNFMKAGLVHADALSTVSRRYAEEIQKSDEFGCGMQDLLRRRRSDLHGILNGVDYAVWDPSVDRHIPERYDRTTVDRKPANTRALRERMGLPVRAGVPVIGMISRLADQKGFDLLPPIMDRLLAMDLQLVILGTGDPRYHRMFEDARSAHPDRIGVVLGFDNALAHLIEAGSDLFLMPSRYEPCGLNQIYSLRYGTVPVVRATGGLDDTIVDVRTDPAAGTGFKFIPYDGGALLATVADALAAFSDAARWRAIMTRGMEQDFSWHASAQSYVGLYRKVTGL